MSFDFMVFDPAVPPRNDEGFMAWYDAEVGRGEHAGTPSSHDGAVAECEALHTFYKEMCEMFTPFNGPDDVPLPGNAPQIRILRTCEYNFRPHSLYMSFRWPAQDMARGAASAFAKEAGLGYFHCSAQHGQAIFPDGTKLWPTGKYPGYGAGKALL